MICRTLINQVRTLDVALNSSNAPPTSPITTECPQPLITHPILTAALLDAIMENNIVKLTAFDHLYYKYGVAKLSSPDILKII